MTPSRIGYVAPASASVRRVLVPEPEGEPAVARTIATAFLAAAALTQLGYALWVSTARRALFADIAEGAAGQGALAPDTAAGSDTVDTVWSTLALLTALGGLALWLLVWRGTHRRLGAGGFAGLSLVLVGLAVVAVAAGVGAGVDGDAALAARAALAASMVGVGFGLSAIGMAVGAVTVAHADRGPFLGYAGWSSG